MIRLFRWILGYVKFTFSSGFAEDFLTQCFADGIEIRDVSLCENGFIAYCNLKTYKRLHRYALRHGGKVRIIKKYGLPFILLPLKNRMGFFTGMLVFAVLISFFSSFIWNVEIVGNNRVSDTALYTYLENHNLKKAVMWSSVDRDKICWDMMSEFEDISWVHINKIGTTARVEINETKLADKDGDKNKLQGINVFRREIEVVAYREQKDITVKERKKYKRIRFFWADIPLYFDRKKGDITQESEKNLVIKDVTLPIGITEYEECFLSSKSKMLTDEELLELAKRKLIYQQEKEFDGFEIINQTENHVIDADKCVMTSSYIIKRK